MSPRPSRRFSLVGAKNRRAIIVVLAAIFMIVMIAMLAFSIDIGVVVASRTEIQRSVDCAAFAGAAMLGYGATAADQNARNYVNVNPIFGDTPDLIQVETGFWDEQTQTFTPGVEPPSAVRVYAELNDQSTFFGRVLGTDYFNVSAEAIATYRPRDIVVVLDYSASMNDDSELKQIRRLGRTAVENGLKQIYQELGSPQFGVMQWDPQYISSTNTSYIMRTLGLDGVPYPYPGGDWSSYISYVRTNSAVSNAGYRNRYGYLTLVNYWLESQPMYSETPDLWRTSEQPITAVKDAVKVFLAYMQEVETNDRVGLAVYTAADGTGLLETGLTADYQLVEDTSRQRQAGHYDHYTNIGAGMEKARVELEEHGRPGALKMVVLMTDGLANRPGSTSNARQYALNEAQQAADDGFPIVTISLGTDADADLLQSIADLTGGVHFNIPGGGAVAEYEEDLQEIFRKIADERPLLLVK